MSDAKPIHDVVDQRRPARSDPDTDDLVDEETVAAETMEADPADVADQNRDAPVIDEDEPWP